MAGATSDEMERFDWLRRSDWQSGLQQQMFRASFCQ